MQDTNQETEPQEKLHKAKTASLIGQIFAALWIAAWSAVKFFKAPEATSVTDFILSGFSIAGCFSPVYVNMIFDKIKEMRIGG